MYLFFLLSIVIIALDQFSKWWIVHNMELYQSISVITDFFYITSHRNRGAAFGILQDQRWLFIIVTSCVVIGIIVYMIKMKKETILTKLALSLILGGAIGNFIDRIRTGEVVDFFHFQFGSYQFPIFNVADSALCVGVVLFLIASLTETKKEQVNTSVGDA
ncbi:signal peptidase II [Shimazuella alba]|uniref:Lipoprotein signal peptidase n=1 Tax=Shimazuella alba TaxID=2690964 RepID=A0A6I4VSL5_9BACL|nr:lipoprotein signal peptidase [Shimazuella alba]